MRKLQLLHIKDETEGTDFNYRNMLLAIAKAPIGARGPVSLADMRIGLPLMEKLEAAGMGDDLILTEEEHQFLAARAEAWPWPNMHPVYLAFGEAIIKASHDQSTQGS